MKLYETHAGQEFKIEISYSLGGVNYATYKQERRGYYLHVTPVERKLSDCGSYRTESFMVFSGYKHLLIELGRDSKKSYQKAIQLEMWREWADKIIKTIINEKKIEAAA